MFQKQQINVVVLVGTREFGRCPHISWLPTALWPVAGKSVLERLLVHLADQGVKQAVICSNGDSALLQKSIHIGNRLVVEFLNEQLPVGPAGCIRDAAADETDALLLVLPANMICPPKIDTLISAHCESQSDLTVMFNPSNGNGKPVGEPADIYVCDTSILEYIPKQGYFDIKEGLIPKMLRAGKTVRAVVLPNHIGNFRDRQGYLSAIANYLENDIDLNTHLKSCEQSTLQDVWIASNATVDQGSRILGPTVVMDGAHVEEGAIVFGPTIIGQNVHIAENSVVINSVLWDEASIGPNCRIRNCILDYNATVPGNTTVEEHSIPFESNGFSNRLIRSALEVTEHSMSKLHQGLPLQLTGIKEELVRQCLSHKTKIVGGVAAGCVFIAFLWSFWPNIKELWNIWQRSDEYSSGLLVPFLAVYILWSRRHDLAQCAIKPSIWGVFLFLAALTVRLFGLFFMYGSLERLSIALSIAALVLLLFGWRLFRKVSTVLLFLCLMLPWPNRIQAAVALPLQRWATSSAVFCLEMIGYGVIREGNVIHIGNATVAVAEACNGLRMVTAFFMIGGLVVLLVKRAWWEKLLILASSLPIALLCNTTRLVITAFAFTVLNGEHWEKIFHDFGGYAMMPLAIAAIVIELWLLTKLTTFPIEQKPIIVARRITR